MIIADGVLKTLKDSIRKIEIPVIDDFICHEITTWSELGVIDILKATIKYYWKAEIYF